MNQFRRWLSQPASLTMSLVGLVGYLLMIAVGLYIVMGDKQ